MKLIREIYSFILLTFFVLLGQAQATAQDQYQAQIEAFQQCFQDKNGNKLKAYLIPDISFPPIPQNRLTPEFKDRLFQQFFSSIMVSVEVKSTEPGEVTMIYDYGDFQGLGKRESVILFNEEGMITRIQEVEDIIQISIDRRNAEKPEPGALGEKYPLTKVEIALEDITVHANLYEVNANAPVILLCHQFGWNKFEYADIAPRLNEMGFNALAVDLTGGGSFQNHNNETVQGRGDIDRTKLLDFAEEELEATINYLHKRYQKKVTVWGSSYSATLVIFAAERNRHVNASISFSGFNHFQDQRPQLETIIPKIKKPMFMTSSKSEASIMTEILKDIKLRKQQYHFIPQGGGEHGAKALWNSKDDASEYWTEITAFLKEVYPNH